MKELLLLWLRYEIVMKAPSICSSFCRLITFHNAAKSLWTWTCHCNSSFCGLWVICALVDVLPVITCANKHSLRPQQLCSFPHTPKIQHKADYVTQCLNCLLLLKWKCFRVQTLRGVKILASGSLLWWDTGVLARSSATVSAALWQPHCSLCKVPRRCH